jgi:transcriptional regulator with XRE-family HTH domain
MLGAFMGIGYRLRSLGEQKKLSQEDLEKRTGLLRCYISRGENGRTVPAVETLEKMVRGMEMPLYQLMYDGQVPAPLSLHTVLLGRRYDSQAARSTEALQKWCRNQTPQWGDDNADSGAPQAIRVAAGPPRTR